MEFKPGDFVVATKNNPYRITNSNMLLGVVASCGDDLMSVAVLAHNNQTNIGSVHVVHPSYFEKLCEEQLKKNPLVLLLTHFMCDAYGGYNIPLSEIINGSCDISEFAFVAGGVYSQNTDCTINDLINILTKKHKGVLYKK